jgi:hypothetical protein
MFFMTALSGLMATNRVLSRRPPAAKKNADLSRSALKTVLGILEQPLWQE